MSSTCISSSTITPLLVGFRATFTGYRGQDRHAWRLRRRDIDALVKAWHDESGAAWERDNYSGRIGAEDE